MAEELPMAKKGDDEGAVEEQRWNTLQHRGWCEVRREGGIFFQLQKSFSKIFEKHFSQCNFFSKVFFIMENWFRKLFMEKLVRKAYGKHFP